MPAALIILSSPRDFYFGLPRVTQFFLLAIVLLTLAFHLSFTPKTVSQGPTILTTVGIFATFVGIALGLSQFDTTNIQASVPALLSGLKTAFWASVFGVGGALTLKFRDFIVGPRQQAGDLEQGDDTTATDLANHLKSINRALVGNEEGSGGVAICVGIDSDELRPG
jgi:hypothetical protein